jgi:hypothetical protein
VLLHASMNGPPPLLIPIVPSYGYAHTEKKGDGRVLLRRARKRGGRFVLSRLCTPCVPTCPRFFFLFDFDVAKEATTESAYTSSYTFRKKQKKDNSRKGLPPSSFFFFFPSGSFSRSETG